MDPPNPTQPNPTQPNQVGNSQVYLRDTALYTPISFWFPDITEKPKPPSARTSSSSSMVKPAKNPVLGSVETETKEKAKAFDAIFTKEREEAIKKFKTAVRVSVLPEEVKVQVVNFAVSIESNLKALQKSVKKNKDHDPNKTRTLDFEKKELNQGQLDLVFRLIDEHGLKDQLTYLTMFQSTCLDGMSLELTDFPNLESVMLAESNVLSVKISNCPKLEYVHVAGNAKLDVLSLSGCPALKAASASATERLVDGKLVGLRESELDDIFSPCGLTVKKPGRLPSSWAFSSPSLVI